jgi:UDP-N-acetylglucosamine 2-epimerase (non-hydrolysing)
VLTDSGGLQEEATLLGVPTYTLRYSSERTTTLLHGTNLLLGDDPADIQQIQPERPSAAPAPIPLWDGRAGARIAAALMARLADA